MSENASLFEKTEEIINADIRPYIEMDGGFIELKEVTEEGIVSVELKGACSGCPSAAMTLKAGVERILKAKIPEIKLVQLAR